MYWNKRFLLIIALLFLVFGNVLAQSPYRIRLADSTYAAQLRGVTGTRTAGITITGTYKSNFRAHQFNVTTTGRYDLYIDATGTGSSYSKDAVWSGSVGKSVIGKTDLERTVSLGVYADPDSNAQMDTQAYEDESVTLIKLAPEVLAAMATGGSFTSDSLRDMVGDSVAALSADGATIINDGTFKARVINDTTYLSALTVDSVGTEINLRQISSTNILGGGTLILGDSTVFRAKYGSGIDLPGVSWKTAVSGKRLYRKSVLEGEPVTPQMFGAVVDGVTDDKAKIVNTIVAAHALGLTTHLPDGSYKVSTGGITIDPSININDPILITGAGRNRTFVVAADTAFNFIFADYKRGIETSNLTVSGPGSSVSASVGFAIKNTTGTLINNVFVDEFESAFALDRIEGATFRRVFVDDAKWAYNWKDGGTVNGNLWDNCYSTTNIDSIIYRAGAGYGNVVRNGEGGNCPILVLMDPTNFGQISFHGGNFESIDSVFFINNNNSLISVIDTRFLAENGSGVPFAQINGSSQMFLSNVVMQQFSRPLVYASSTLSRVYSTNNRGTVVDVSYTGAQGTVVPASDISEFIFDNAGLTTDTLAYGRLTRWIPRKLVRATAGNQERLYYSGRYYSQQANWNLLTGSDWRISTSNDSMAQTAQYQNPRIVTRRANITFATGTDTTLFTVVVDTNGFTDVHYANLMISDHDNVGYIQTITNLEVYNGAAGTGTLTFTVVSRNRNLAGLTRRAMVFAVIDPRKWE